jgi:FlgD Ig-like domain
MTRDRRAGLSRFQLGAFAALVIATVAAFFIAQHIKVSTPLISGTPTPFPASINPLSGGTCYDRALHRQVDYRTTSISFYLLHASDRVDVYIVNQGGARVATLATGRFMKAALFPHEVPTRFTWDGRRQDGSVASDGSYYFTVHLIHQGRTVTIASGSGPLPVTVDTRSRCP